MSRLSIRKLTPELERAIAQAAKKKQITKTAVVLDALSEAFHIKKKSPSPVRRQVRSFFGKMSVNDYDELRKATRDFSAIDAEMWK